MNPEPKWKSTLRTLMTEALMSGKETVPVRPEDLYKALEEINQSQRLLNTPETEDFDKAVPLEAAHQVLRWSASHDAGKNPQDWFWLIGYLAGKALAAALSGDLEKAKHHTISTAAALRNWHAHLRSGESAMRPGIEEPK